MKAVIFDMDGVLVDSFEANRKAFDAVLSRRYGFNVSKEEFLGYFGRDPRDITRMILKNHGVVDLDEVDDIYAEKRTVFNRLAGEEVKLLPGVVKTLSRLKDMGFKLAVASSNSRSSIEYITGRMGIAGYFEAYVGFEDTVKAKPDPEIFLKAAEKLGVKPAECWVIEDSLHGVEAGKKAGMKVVGVQTGFRSRRELERAGSDVVVGDLRGLRQQVSYR
jgi:HAD superfamily hydrolase (TIGR01509 family)